MTSRHTLVKLFIVAMVIGVFSASGWAQIRTLTESTKPVVSPDGSRSIIVDRIYRIIDGEPERYPSRMLVRIIDAGGTSTRQRRLEASQIRLLNSPRWFDPRWVAFTYNISKNANGVVYVDALTADALQIEFVALRRHMAATDSIETELTSLDVTEYTGKNVTRVSNITRRNRAVFPLLLRPIPPYDTSPFPLVFAEQIKAALKAYHDFLAKRGYHLFSIEEASESFDKEEKHMAALACIDGRPYLLISPLEAETPAAAMEQVKTAALMSDIKLICLESVTTATHSADENSSSTVPEDTEPAGHFGEYRFRTSWKDETTVLVEQEIFESEEQEPRRVPLYTFTLDGKLERIGNPVIIDENTSETLDNDTLSTSAQNMGSDPLPEVSDKISTPPLPAHVAADTSVSVTHKVHSTPAPVTKNAQTKKRSSEPTKSRYSAKLQSAQQEKSSTKARTSHRSSR